MFENIRNAQWTWIPIDRERMGLKGFLKYMLSTSVHGRAEQLVVLEDS
ncbi:hypothetical protein AB4186_09905 [Vibrio lentus]